MPALLALALLGSAPAAAASFDVPEVARIARFHATGAQIYVCAAKPGESQLTWAFREPVATLIEEGRTVGRHFAGPRWELDDGSLVQGHLQQSLPGATPADIPLLKLDVVKNSGSGRLAQAGTIYRLNTHGGQLQGPCDAPGELRAVPYSADYLFAR